MSLVPTFHDQAERELNEGANTYAGLRPGLGHAFIDAVENAVELLCESPFIGKAVQGQVRAWIVRGFPYSLYYRVRGEELRILAVAHHRRRPSYWRGRS